MKNINMLTQWKKWISQCDVHARVTHQKHLRSGRSTRSAVDIFNTLRVFTKEPIREQEIKLECLNLHQNIIWFVKNKRKKERERFSLFHLW